MPAKKQPAVPERVGPMLSRQERLEAIELFGRAFSNPTWMESHMRQGLYRPPIFRPEHTRVAIADGGWPRAWSWGRGWCASAR